MVAAPLVFAKRKLPVWERRPASYLTVCLLHFLLTACLSLHPLAPSQSYGFAAKGAASSSAVSK